MHMRNKPEIQSILSVKQEDNGAVLQSAGSCYKCLMQQATWEVTDTVQREKM